MDGAAKMNELGINFVDLSKDYVVKLRWAIVSTTSTDADSEL